MWMKMRHVGRSSNGLDELVCLTEGQCLVGGIKVVALLDEVEALATDRSSMSATLPS